MAVGAPGWSRARRASGRDKTRDQIIRTALGLFAERGYIGVRVEDIATAAGVSRATFYKYFAERDEILAELFSRLVCEACAPEVPTDGSLRDRVSGLLSATIDRLLEQELLARFVYSLPIRHDAVLPGGTSTPAVFEQVRALLDEAARDGGIRPGVPVALATELLGRAFEAAMRDWAEGRVTDPRPRLGELVDVLFGGIAPAVGNGATKGRVRRR